MGDDTVGCFSSCSAFRLIWEVLSARFRGMAPDRKADVLPWTSLVRDSRIPSLWKEGELEQRMLGSVRCRNSTAGFGEDGTSKEPIVSVLFRHPNPSSFSSHIFSYSPKLDNLSFDEIKKLGLCRGSSILVVSTCEIGLFLNVNGCCCDDDDDDNDVADDVTVEPCEGCDRTGVKRQCGRRFAVTKRCKFEPNSDIYPIAVEVIDVFSTVPSTMLPAPVAHSTDGVVVVATGCCCCCMLFTGCPPWCVSFVQV